MGKNPEKKKARSKKLKFLSTETHEEDGDINVYALYSSNPQPILPGRFKKPAGLLQHL